jgi:hypothetical protein
MLLWHEKKFLSTYSVIPGITFEFEYLGEFKLCSYEYYCSLQVYLWRCAFIRFFYLNLFGHLSSWLITLSIFSFDFKFSEILEFSLVPRILSTVYRRFHSTKYQYTQFHATYFEKFTVKSKNTGKILHSFLPSSLSTQTVSFCVFSFYVNFTTHIISIRQI